MADALFLSVIQKLESSLVKVPEITDFERNDTEGLINELRMVMDFLRDNKVGEGSRLSYFIGDVVEFAQNILEIGDGPFELHGEIICFRSWIQKLKIHMLQSEVDSAEIKKRSEIDDDEEDVVGLEEDVELVLGKEILDKVTGLEILSIRGIVGSGKTTLARQLYNHADVASGFERRAWVRISGDLSYKEILMELIPQVVDCERDELVEQMKRADNQTLQQMLHQNLRGMRFLIVLDDLEKNMSYKSIFKGLPNEDKGSRLLLTTRITFIQLPTGVHTRRSYDVKSFDSDKSWKLFLKTISSGNCLTGEDIFPKHLEKRGREKLMKICDGMPLAVKDVGRQIATGRRSGGEWEELLESIDLNSTLEPLEVFYRSLDPALKSNFLHLAFFKEDASIRTEKLKQIWDAGEMVIESFAPFLFELGFENIIETTSKSTDIGLKSYRINAVLHRLSVKKAEEEIGLEILRSSGNNRPYQSPRHRIVICSRDKFDQSTNQEEHLISLFFHGGGYFDASPSYWESFKQLKVLDMEDFGLKVVPKCIGQLTELRYLGLRNNYIQDLPVSLRLLKSLEVLDIAQNFMVEVPDIIWEIGSLCHLYMSDVICRKPLKIDALQNLETLTYISLKNWTYELSGLQMMTGLRKLGIEEVDGSSDVSKLLTSLASLKDLDHLILRGFRFKRMPCLDEIGSLYNISKLKLDGLLPRLPSADSYPPKLLYLSLVNTCCKEDPMPVLEKLFLLTHLKLRNAYMGQQMVISNRKFSYLKVLWIEDLCYLREVQVGKDTLINLTKLVIKNCPNLETIPTETRWLTQAYSMRMVTTKNNATKIREAPFISQIRGGADISP